MRQFPRIRTSKRDGILNARVQLCDIFLYDVHCTYVTIAIKEIRQGDAGLNSKPYVLQLVRVIYRSTFKLFELKLLNLSCMHGCMTLRPICKKAASIEVVFLNDLLKIITEHSRIIQRDGGGRWSDG